MKTIWTLAMLSGLLCFQPAQNQQVAKFPIDPYLILKSWNYDDLIKSMGEGKEIMSTSRGQSYLSGLSYPFELIGMRGNLEFTFNKDSIALIQFRSGHPARVTSADLTGGKSKDPTLSPQYDVAIRRLDSLQKRDSVSRDSVVRAISEVMGVPLSNSRTAATEKFARHSATWINRGYSCLYKDYMDYSEIVFSLSTLPAWAVGEFGIPAGSQMLRKTQVSTRKLSWSSGLIGLPAASPIMTYASLFLLVEFTTGQRYVAAITENGPGYLPDFTFDDCDGDAIPEVWVRVPADLTGSVMRHYLFTMKFKEPNLIFNGDELLPASIQLDEPGKITINYADGSSRQAPMTKPEEFASKTLIPAGFSSLVTTRLNSDGSANFTGTINLPGPGEKGASGHIEITYKHTTGGWEPDVVKYVPKAY